MILQVADELIRNFPRQSFTKIKTYQQKLHIFRVKMLPFTFLTDPGLQKIDWQNES